MRPLHILEELAMPSWIDRKDERRRVVRVEFMPPLPLRTGREMIEGIEIEIDIEVRTAARC